MRDLSETGPHARGKQRLDRGTIWYTAQSGIWQTVWLEPVPAAYVDRLVLVPHLASGELEVTVHATGTTSPTWRACAWARAGGAGRGRRPGGRARAGAAARGAPVVAAGPAPLRRGGHPRLGTRDRVTSYAGLRSFGVGHDAHGHPRLLLNGEPQAHVGVLDQGYWPDGLLTPPSDEAMVHDIETMKDLGFTMLRKHAKVEPLRWYAHCDRLGMLVWQDVVNGGGRYRELTTTRPARHDTWVPDRLHRLYGRGDRAGRREFRDEVRATVELLGNVVSLAVWTPFNEGWGQFDANAVAREVARLDPTRQVNHVSGWVDQGGGDVRSFHAYLRPFRLPAREHRRRRGAPRVVALTEYGGFSLRVEGHDWSTREFGYRHLEDAAAFDRSFTALHEPLVDQARDGLAATVYTQLSDVEDELNGLVTWDREVLKLDADVVRRVTARLRAAMTGD